MSMSNKSNILVPEEIQHLNWKMIQRGAPIERDDTGYNAADFNRMLYIGMLKSDSLTLEEAFASVVTLYKYRNTQLTEYKDEIEESLAFYKDEFTKKHKDEWEQKTALTDAKNGANHTKDDYAKRELNYYGIDKQRGGFVKLAFREFVGDFDVKNFGGGWKKFDNDGNVLPYSSAEGTKGFMIPVRVVDAFLEAVKSLGKFGYEAPAQMIADVAAFKEKQKEQEQPQEQNEPEESKSDIKLTATGKRNQYGCDLFELNVNDYNINQELWGLKDKGLKYVDTKSDREKVTISTTKSLLPRLIKFCKEKGYDASEIEEFEAKRNKSDNTLIDTSTLDLPFKPYDFQVADAKEIVSKKKALIGHDMGCVSGKSKVRIKENGKAATREVYVENLFRLIQNDPTIQIKALVSGRFAYMPIKTVIDKGVRDTIRLEAGDTFIECTPDHEIYTEHGWIEAEQLSVGDTVFTNGVPDKCIECGSIENLITYERAKWLGYCKRCMTRLKKNGYAGIVKKVDKHGYIRLVGNGTKNMPDYEKMKGQGGIYEHHQVWYEHTGHVVQEGEVVHHKDLNKKNNEFSNLQLMTDAEHKKLHADINKNSLPQFNSNIEYIVKNGKKIFYVPQKAKITNISPASKQRVYDIAIDDAEIHNFVCNGIVVHNCGKTFIATLVGMSIDEPKLVICPESLRLNWQRELERTHKGADIKVIYSDDKEFKKEGTLTFGKDWTIMGYASARKFAGLIIDEHLDCLFVDESHKCKAVNNYGKPASQQAEAVMAIAKSATYTYLMTGTPMPTRNKDLFNSFVMLGEITNPHSFPQFGKTYCDGYQNGFGWNFDGSSNTTELHEKLAKYMTRRLKSDVLPNLTKQRQYIPLDCSLSKEYRDVEKRMHNLEDGDTYMGLAMTGRRLLSQAKLPSAIELAESLLDADESVVIVSEFNDTLDALMDYCQSKKIDACCIRGGMSDAAKQQAVDDFQSGKAKVCCLNLIAGGVGITLTKAHAMICCDYDWTPANMTQVEDRICRTGQTENCVIYYLHHEKAILDQIFMSMISDKSENIDRVVDNAENTVDLRAARSGSSTYLDLLKKRIQEDNASKPSKKRASKKAAPVVVEEEEPQEPEPDIDIAL